MNQVIIIKTVKNEKTKEVIYEKEFVATESINNLWNKPVYKFKENGTEIAVLKERLGVSLHGKGNEVIVYTQK